MKKEGKSELSNSLWSQLPKTGKVNHQIQALGMS